MCKSFNATCRKIGFFFGLLLLICSCAPATAPVVTTAPLSAEAQALEKQWQKENEKYDELRAVAVAQTPSKKTQLATKLFDDMRAIADAVVQFRINNDKIPYSMTLLTRDGFLADVPTMGPELGNGKYKVQQGYDDMDGVGRSDDAIYTSKYVPMETCEEFNRLYADAPLNDGTVFDSQANDSKYPAEVYGVPMKVFAIKWETSRPDCEVIWVIKYHQ